MVVKIKRSSLQDLLSNKENGKNTSSSSSRRRQRAKPNYRRFCAVSSFGNLNALAAAAKQTLLDGEEHFGNTLSAVNEKSKQGKRRVELRQQQFAWEEEHRSLTNERMTLEREILEIVGKVSTTGLSGPLDEMKMYDGEFVMAHKPRAKEQLHSIRQMIHNIEPYEAATVLAEVIEANGLMYNATEYEREKQEHECRQCRSAVYHAMRGLLEDSDNDDKGNAVGRKGSSSRRKTPTTRSMLWDRISKISHSKDVLDVDAVHVMYEEIVIPLDQHIERVKQMKKQLKQMTQNDRNTNNNNTTNSNTNNSNTNNSNTNNNTNNNTNENTTTPIVATTDLIQKTIGGWNVNDHSMFIKNWKECIDRGKGHGVFRKRMLLLLPHINRDAVTEHISWFEKSKYLQRQLREENICWERSVKEKLMNVAIQIKQIYMNEKQNEERQRQLLILQKRGGKLHAKLHEMRNMYVLKQQEIDRERDRLYQLQLTEEKKRNEIENKRRHLENEKVTVFQNEREVEHQQKQEAKAAQMKYMEDVSKANAPMREKRIEHRREVLAQREEIKKMNMLSEERIKLNNLQALERLKEQCLYFEKIKDIQENQDPKHVLQVTRAFDAAVKELEALRAAGFGVHARGHAPLNGFQSKTIVGDIRFKLVEQLRSAGLQATPYAQACIINMAREMRPMPQMRSSIFAPRIQP